MIWKICWKPENSYYTRWWKEIHSNSRKEMVRRFSTVQDTVQEWQSLEWCGVHSANCGHVKYIVRICTSKEQIKWSEDQEGIVVCHNFQKKKQELCFMDNCQEQLFLWLWSVSSWLHEPIPGICAQQSIMITYPHITGNHYIISLTILYMLSVSQMKIHLSSKKCAQRNKCYGNQVLLFDMDLLLHSLFTLHLYILFDHLHTHDKSRVYTCRSHFW